MGQTNWSDAAFQARQNHRRTTNKTAFTYDKQVRDSGIAKVHDQMNPFGAIRESRDSDEHPESVAIAVIFDETGSMGNVPRVLQTKLGALMKVLIQKGYVAHPQILFGAVGDAYSDIVPLQIGQFESGLEMDDDLAKLYLEGNGGGQVHETYELGMYFMARHTQIDCYDKRGQKGYLFTIGDEKPYDVIRRQHVKDLMGDDLEQDIRIEKIVAEVQQRYEFFHIIPTNTSHGGNPDIQARWKKLLGERVILLENAEAVCETIAMAIGLCEGTLDNLADGAADLVGSGSDPVATKSASTALSRFAATRGPRSRVVTGLLRAASALTGGDGRL